MKRAVNIKVAAIVFHPHCQVQMRKRGREEERGEWER
jgi:hypothetical protein